MNQELLEAIKSKIKTIEKAIVEKKYSEITTVTSGNRPTLAEIEKVINEYGGKVSFAPEEAYKTLHVGEVKNSAPSKYWSDFDLWINGKQSDLTLSLSISLIDKRYIISIDDLQVL